MCTVNIDSDTLHPILIKAVINLSQFLLSPLSLSAQLGLWGGGTSRAEPGAAAMQTGAEGRMGDASFSIHEVCWPFDCHAGPSEHAPRNCFTPK